MSKRFIVGKETTMENKEPHSEETWWVRDREKKMWFWDFPFIVQHRGHAVMSDEQAKASAEKLAEILNVAMAPDSAEYEYGIACRTLDESHRDGMTEDEAREWLQGWIDDGGAPDAFQVIRRPIGNWEYAP